MTFGALGISAMMHGYIALDKDGNMLAPFQTWRNSNTQQAADELTQQFRANGSRFAGRLRTCTSACWIMRSI